MALEFNTENCRDAGDVIAAQLDRYAGAVKVFLCKQQDQTLEYVDDYVKVVLDRLDALETAPGLAEKLVELQQVIDRLMGADQNGDGSILDELLAIQVTGNNAMELAKSLELEMDGVEEAIQLQGTKIVELENALADYKNKCEGRLNEIDIYIEGAKEFNLTLVTRIEAVENRLVEIENTMITVEEAEDMLCNYSTHIAGKVEAGMNVILAGLVDCDNIKVRRERNGLARKVVVQPVVEEEGPSL